MKAFLVPSMRCRTTGAERARGPDTADTVFPCYLNESCGESRAGEGEAAGRSEKGQTGRLRGRHPGCLCVGISSTGCLSGKGLWKTPIMVREVRQEREGSPAGVCCPLSCRGGW